LKVESRRQLAWFPNNNGGRLCLESTDHVATVLVLTTERREPAELLLAHVNDFFTTVTHNDRCYIKSPWRHGEDFEGLLRGTAAAAELVLSGHVVSALMEVLTLAGVDVGKLWGL